MPFVPQVMLGTNDAGHIHGEPERVGEAIAALVKDLRRRALGTICLKLAWSYLRLQVFFGG